jgi:hypothetical protein
MSLRRVVAGTPLQPLLDEGVDLLLSEGAYDAPLVVTRSLRIEGEPGAVIDAHGRGVVLAVVDDDLEVALRGVVLRGGHADGGAGVRLTGWSAVRLDQCAVQECSVPGNRGGGALALRGRLELSECSFLGNRAVAGSDVLATGVAEVVIDGGQYSGDIAAREGAQLVVRRASVRGRLDVRGTTTRGPSVRVEDAVIEGGVHNDAVFPGTLNLREDE